MRLTKSNLIIKVPAKSCIKVQLNTSLLTNKN
jgi:hypothetical protein